MLHLLLCGLQGKFLKDYAAAHEALSKLGTQLPVSLYGKSTAASSPFGSLSESYSTQEVGMLGKLAAACLNVMDTHLVSLDIQTISMNVSSLAGILCRLCLVLLL